MSGIVIQTAILLLWTFPSEQNCLVFTSLSFRFVHIFFFFFEVITVEEWTWTLWGQGAEYYHSISNLLPFYIVNPQPTCWAQYHAHSKSFKTRAWMCWAPLTPLLSYWGEVSGYLSPALWLEFYLNRRQRERFIFDCASWFSPAGIAQRARCPVAWQHDRLGWPRDTFPSPFLAAVRL